MKFRFAVAMFSAWVGPGVLVGCGGHPGFLRGCLGAAGAGIGVVLEVVGVSREDVAYHARQLQGSNPDRCDHRRGGRGGQGRESGEAFSHAEGLVQQKRDQ